MIVPLAPSFWRPRLISTLMRSGAESFTVRTVEAVSVPRVAEIVVVPADNAVKRPELSMEATDGVEEFQIALLAADVRSQLKSAVVSERLATATKLLATPENAVIDPVRTVAFIGATLRL